MTLREELGEEQYERLRMAWMLRNAGWARGLKSVPEDVEEFFSPDVEGYGDAQG